MQQPPDFREESLPGRSGSARSRHAARDEFGGKEPEVRSREPRSLWLQEGIGFQPQHGEGSSWIRTLFAKSLAGTLVYVNAPGMTFLVASPK